jgi:L-rhamnose mutarotase
MKREAFKMFLKPGCEAEYEKRHGEIWPELKKLLSNNGVYDYSIYWDKDTNILFACQKTKGGESSQDMGSNPIVQKWWDYMADIMETNPDNSPVSIPLYEIFRME